MNIAAQHESIWGNSHPTKTRSRTFLGYAALWFAWQHGETSSSTRKHLVSLALVIATLLFFIKKSREVQKRQQKAPVLCYPLYTTAQYASGTPLNIAFVCLFSPNSLKLQFTSKCHHHRSLTLMPFLPSAPPEADCEPHVSAGQLLPSCVSSHPKALWTCYPGTVRRSRVPEPVQPCLKALQGLWAGVGWHPCTEPVCGDTSLVGLNPAFHYKAHSPTSHPKQPDKNQVKCSNISLTLLI